MSLFAQEPAPSRAQPNPEPIEDWSAESADDEVFTEVLVPLIVGCALFMELLDSTVITTALPAMSRSLHEDPIKLNLAITSYLLSLAVFIPISAWMADRFGARMIFRAAIVIFTIGSVLCGLSQSLPELVAARILQGCGGAMMVPVGRLVILKTVPKRHLVTAMSYLSIPALIGPVVGPPVGGFIVTYSNWRWIFFINVPICVLGIVMVTLFIEDIRETDVPPLDLHWIFPHRDWPGGDGLWVRVGRARRTADGGRDWTDGRRGGLHGTLLAALPARGASDHKPGLVQDYRPSGYRRWAADYFEWGSARCRFCWRCCCN